MSNDTKPDTGTTVQLTPETPKAAAKLAVVQPGPRAVNVKVPAATPVATAPKAAPVGDDDAVAPASDVIKKGDLLDEVVAVTGVKRSDAKSVTEALFAAIATHLQDGRNLQVPPLGKVRLVNSKDVGQGAKALTVKIRTPNPD